MGIHDRLKHFNDEIAKQTQSQQQLQQGQARTASTRGQRLPTTQLEAAGFATTKNPLLQMLWSEVQDYNKTFTHPSSLGKQAALHKVAQLDALLSWSGEYLTSKWKKDEVTDKDSKRVKRWDALAQLNEDVAKELEGYGARILTGPGDFSEISGAKRNYWLERLDPGHRAGYVLSPLFAKWSSLRPLDSTGKPVPFFTWLGTPQGLLEVGQLNSVLQADFFKTVAYHQSEPLWKRMVYFDNANKLRKANGNLFHSASRSTAFSGQGWAIFVCSLDIPGPVNQPPRKYLFSYSHKTAEFHHSTFLGGAPVAAAGEWIVDQGEVKVITAKSGHYRPRPQDLERLVQSFPSIPGQAIIRPDLGDYAAHTAVRFHRVADLRQFSCANAPALRRAQVAAAIPSWANQFVTEDHTTHRMLLPSIPV
ncbi:MAG: hypothetical protein IT454_12660 [Planctomycetes bacterium]|nr:hypothetical protein [Planctomycetota bacterium]